MQLKKILYVMAALTLSACATTPSSSSESEPPASSIDTSKAPDYSSSSKKMTMYSYAAPNKGFYTKDGTIYQTKDENGNPITFQTKEMYQQYKDAGFDYLLIDANDPYNGEDWESSSVKKLFDLAESVGLKTILFDQRIYKLSTSETPIVGEGYAYASQEELVAYLKTCIQDYSKHPAFHGIMLKDEPSYLSFPAIGSLYKGIKEISEDIFVQCNLFPCNPSVASSYEEGATSDGLLNHYRNYVSGFVEATGASYIMVDSYPMRVKDGDINSPQLDINHLPTMQICAEVAEKESLELYLVVQSSSWTNNGVRKTRPVTLNDLYWQWNVALGFGVDQISYFTYMRRPSNSSTGESFDDGTSFVTSNGKTTPLYDWAKTYHPGIKSLASVTMNFSYNGLCSYLNSTSAACDVSFLSNVKDAESFKYVDMEKTENDSKSILLATEMIDKSNSQYGYMCVNATDPVTTSSKSKSVVAFKDGVDAVRVIDDEGNISDFAASSGTYTVELEPGRGVFIMPYSY